MPGVLIVEAMAQTGAVAVLSEEENRGRIALLRRHRRRPLQADRGARRRARARVRARAGARPDRTRPRDGQGRRRARGAGNPHLRRGAAVIGTTNGNGAISITGFGCHVPERGADERRARAVARHLGRVDPGADRHPRAPRGRATTRRSPTSACRPRGRRWSTRACAAKDVDLIIVATVTPDMFFPSTGVLLADQLGAPDAAAYDLSAGCTGFMYALAQAYGMLAGGLAQRALVVGGDMLSKIVDWNDRATCVLFGDGAGAVVLERVDEGGFLGFELGAEGARRRPSVHACGRVTGACEGRDGGRGRALRAHERPRGLQVRHARARLVRAGDHGGVWRRDRTTSTSTSRTRPTCASSIMRRRSSESRRIAS